VSSQRSSIFFTESASASRCLLRLAAYCSLLDGRWESTHALVAGAL